MALTGALAVLGGLSCVWAKTSPSRALVSFWWFVLIVIACMVVVDMQVHADDGLPGVVYIPTVGAIVLRLLVGLRNTARYSLGVLALLIPTGAIYDEWTQVGVLMGVVIVAVTVASGEARTTNADAGDLRRACRMLEASDKRLNDAIRRDAERRE